MSAIPLKIPHRFTAEEYHRLGETGILGEDDRVELIEGEVIDMAPIGHFHAGLASAFIRRLGYPTEGRAVPWAQNPIALGPRSEPQPDFALLRHRADSYKSRLPTAADVLLLVEIADTSLRYDREVKIPLYARHGIPEYWIVNIPGKAVEVHRDPDPEQGRYRETRIVAEGLLAPACFPDLALDVREFLR
jgi:Uma2 family endonuclease